ncbi:LysM peptidoglycan-binding domain-containing protein [Geobacter sulfurreducens]|uniref:LysM peptidoglycan-binding domain-containing protein n=1 Tax=Geobacter sulfurreducens TaxID=35554 RepID=UPI002BF5F3C7|nr:LysM peptidoglycan-binding domain-containing protein [Geobacter sulfurreducens]HML77084.1 LysM peptidoglycan-binding domain-containing protein [Geobacter sulfurreducens]
MKSALRVVSASLVLSMASLAAGGEYLLYAPGASEGSRPSGPDEGVLVKSITVQKGDTLYSLSRKYNGKGGYYPQILLFNEIKNPDLIYAGNKLMVPVAPAGPKAVFSQQPSAVSAAAAKKEPAVRPAREKVAPGAAHREAKRESAVTTSARTPEPAAAAPPAPSRPAAEASRSQTVKADDNEHSLYEKGVSAYKSGAYSQSAELFERFLARYPSSPLVPDATLYRADAFLKMAGQ